LENESGKTLEESKSASFISSAKIFMKFQYPKIQATEILLCVIMKLIQSAASNVKA
jgi:hypothetical protein